MSSNFPEWWMYPAYFLVVFVNAAVWGAVGRAFLERRKTRKGSSA